jgi:CheY-like chemotaxis protein
MEDVVIDITDQKKAIEERLQIQAQLQHAQKMESVGRLAGGVAHDFNNMLTVIIGYTQTAMGQVDPGGKLHKNLQGVLKAARRSADLTKQLLAFARKQIIDPRVLDLNHTVETMNNLFEPFFTTKDVGQGTGLGLATIYGIVKQNNGFIKVYSEPGHGTTFHIYLPSHAEKMGKKPGGKPKDIPAGNGETILIVEDEKTILEMLTAMLQDINYTILAAPTPGKAMALAQKHAGKIHLLLTDVVMPEMNGRDLAAQLASLYPELKFLFMSGYTANVIAHQGVLDEGVQFIQKPFSMKDIAVKIQNILEGADDNDVRTIPN